MGKEHLSSASNSFLAFLQPLPGLPSQVHQGPRGRKTRSKHPRKQHFCRASGAPETKTHPGWQAETLEGSTQLP